MKSREECFTEMCQLSQISCKTILILSNLPDNRSNTFYAFQYTELDYARHLFIENNLDTVLRVYILWFTCVTSCALDLELTHSVKVLQFFEPSKGSQQGNKYLMLL